MADRLDVRRMLLRRGWSEDGGLPPVLRKNGAVWAAFAGDSQLDGPDGKYSIAFGARTPARVIVTACEEAARVNKAKALAVAASEGEAGEK